MVKSVSFNLSINGAGALETTSVTEASLLLKIKYIKDKTRSGAKNNKASVRLSLFICWMILVMIALILIERHLQLLQTPHQNLLLDNVLLTLVGYPVQ